jgi:Tfp pilus assembly protein PilN
MARISSVELDFLRPAGRSSRLAPWLLIAGVIAGALAVLEQRHLASELRAREADIEEMRSMSRRARPAIEMRETDAPELREQIKKANVVLAQMNVPWGELFEAIESADAGGAALLQVEPDARSRSVMLGGAARNIAAVLDYMTRLERTGRLKDVVLVSHEVKTKEPGQPVEFQLAARWVEAP